MISQLLKLRRITDKINVINKAQSTYFYTYIHLQLKKYANNDLNSIIPSGQRIL